MSPLERPALARPRRTFLIAALLLSLALPPPMPPAAAGEAAPDAPAAPLTVVTLYADADATVRSGHPTTNYGDVSPLEASYGGQLDPDEARALLRFDLSALPAGAVIAIAVMELYQEPGGSLMSAAVSAGKAGAPWGEDGVTWNTRPAQPLPGVSVTLDATAGWKAWDLTAFANAWLSAPGANYGIVLQGPAPKTGSLRKFTSREGAAGSRPRLRVTYYVPFSCSLVAQIPLAECEALVALYDATNGPGWANRAGWRDTFTPCSWYGVTCEGGHVTHLELYSNNLKGPIPAQLGNLSSLQVLGLGFNGLTGGIPRELANLSHLYELHLGENQLDGPIPPELGSLASLRTLALSRNQLTGGIPPQLGNLSHLTGLYLSFNPLGGAIPPQLGGLTELYDLYLSIAQLTGSIPPQLGNLTRLRNLSLLYNQLDGPIPPELGSLASLRTLVLSRNQLTGGIPPQLGGLPELYVLDLSSNQLSGAIPPQLGNLTKLQQLDLSYNRLGGAIPAELGGLTKLYMLNLYANQLSGAIPAQLCDPPYNNYLSLAFNALTSGPACIDADDPNWKQTQTVPPAGLGATLKPGPAAQLSWTPILYTADGGYYEIFYSTRPEGPLTRHGQTANKSASGYLAGGLQPGTRYWFRVRTYTPAHGDQQNALTSVWSAEASVTTPPGPTNTPRVRLFLPLILRG